MYRTHNIYLMLTIIVNILTKDKATHTYTYTYTHTQFSIILSLMTRFKS